MAQLIFKRGSLANLNNLAITDGQFIVTTDEGALYVDNGSTRVRLGDFIVVENVASLPTDGANRKAMYYCEAENVLARWNGTDWTQINKQPTNAELKVKLGLDAAGEVTAAIAAAKKAGDDAKTAADNAQAAADKAQGEVDALETYVGTFTHDTAKTVVEYINAKTDGIATSGNLEALGQRVTTVEGDVATIKGDYLKKADKEELVGKFDGVAKDLGDHEADTTVHITAEERATWNGKTTMAQVEAKGYLVADDIAGKADKTQVATDIADAVKTETDNRVLADQAIEAKIGTVAEGKTVVEMIEEAQATATYDDEEVRGLISDNAADIKAIADDYLKGSDKTELQGNIDTVSGKVTTLIGEDANKSVRTIANEELAKQLIAEGAAESLDTLQEIATWIQSHPDDASAMNEAIVALQNKVVLGTYVEGEETKEYATVKAYVEAAIAALQIGDYAKAADLTELAGRVSALETASANYALKTEVGAVSDALDEYKTAHKDDYTNKQIDDAIANAGHASASDLATHTTNTDIHVTTDDKAKWNAAEQNAKDYADDQLEAAKTYADQAELDAIAAAKTETENQVKAEKEAREAKEADLAAAIEAAKTDASNKDAVVLSEAQKYADQAEADAIAAAEGKVNTLAGNVYTKEQTYTQDEVDAAIEAAMTWSEF